MRVPTDSPLRCKARNRAGERCGRWASPGCKVCHYHGAASTGPRTPEGRAVGLSNGIVHGASTKLSTYQRLLAVADPAAFEAAPSTTPIGDELRFARARLVTLVQRETAGETGLLGPILETLDLIRRCAIAQRDVAPGADASGAFTINLRVVGEEPVRSRPAHVGGAAPLSALVDAEGGAGSTEDCTDSPGALADPMDPSRRPVAPVRQYRAEDWPALPPAGRHGRA